MKLENKVAVVTGACGGIGQAIVHALVSDGARVIAADVDAGAAARFAEQFDGAVAAATTDVTDFSQVERMLDFAVEQFGTLDCVINNAGIGRPKPLLEHDPAEDFDLTTQVNQKGVYHGIIAAGRKFVALGKRGVIINTSSVYGAVAGELTFVYNATKAAVDMMTKCAALELAPHGIRCCAVAPGRVNTPLLEQYKALGLWDHIHKEHMRRALTAPEEIGAVFALLASDDANAINGSTLYADDGFASFKLPLLNP